MRNKITLFLALFAFSIQAHAQTRCLASPDTVTLQQPDGSLITVIGKGNLDINYVETPEGFTLVKNAEGIYEYAKKSFNGDLVPSGIRARTTTRTNEENEFLKTITPHLQYSEEKIQEILYGKKARSKMNIPNKEEEHDHESSLSATFPGLGKRKVLLLLIQYPDLKATYTRENFNDMMNKRNYKNIGSYKDFFAANSFGKLDLETDVFGWYMADHNYSYYSNEVGSYRARELVAKAVDAAKAEGVDFSKYDNDKNGEADGILVVHAGPGAEEGSQKQYIWSHRWDLAGHKRVYDNTLIDNYAINPETRGGMNSRMVGIGVFCHEFGHLLGLPDLYDVNSHSEGIGNWSVMAGGNWLNNENTPASFCAYTRTHMKWITPVTIDDEGYYILKPSAKDSVVYKVTTSIPSEYFLLENRQLTGFDTKLNGKGMAIWHINEAVIKSKLSSNRVNADYKKKGVDLEEADGRDDLDRKVNRGDAGDLYPGVTKKTSFNDDSKPNANNYSLAKTGINIFDITILPDSNISFGFSATPRLSFTAPVKICQNELISFQNTSKFASKFTWKFLNGDIDTFVNGSYKFTQPGEFYVKLNGTSLSGVNAEDSLKVLVIPTADAKFDITGQDDYTIELLNVSNNAKSTMVFWGDGASTSLNSNRLAHNYSDTGLFIIKMVCFTEEGCSDTTEQEVRLPMVSPGDPVSLIAIPNPFQGKTKLRFTVAEQGNVGFRVYNMMGQEVLRQKEKVYYAGVHTADLDLEERNLPVGAYTLHVIIDNKPSQIKLIKW